MSIKDIRIGDYKIYSSGSIISIVDEPLIFKLNDLEFIFNFIEDLLDPSQRINTLKDPNNGKKLTISFINFNNPLGLGNKTPVKVGTLDNKDLFLNYRIFSLEEAANLVHYTWLLKDK